MRKIGDDPDASPGLLIASDAVCYIFSFIPSYSLSYSILGLVNTQTENNVCINNVDPNTLTNICQGFADGKLDPNGFTYLTCCSEEFVPSDIGISHTSLKSKLAKWHSPEKRTIFSEHSRRHGISKIAWELV